MVTFRFRDPALTDDVLRATADLRGNMETHIYEEHAVPDADLHPKSEETRAGIGDPDFGDNPEYFDLLLDVVRPRPSQTMRKHVLNKMLSGRLTTGGYKVDPEESHRVAGPSLARVEPDYALRAGIISLARSLGKLPYFFNIDRSGSSLSMLVSRRRAYSPNGTYVGIRYVPTNIGRRVYMALKNEGVL